MIDTDRLVRAFSTPDDADTFVQLVLERSHSLVDAGLWAGLAKTRLDGWFRGFNTDADRYFAACLLDALIFRSEDQTRALMLQVFQRAIPDLLRRFPPIAGPRSDWMERLKTGTRGDPGLRVVPVIRLSDPPTKSGPLLARLYKRHLALKERWMIWPWQVDAAAAKGVTAFLFVDDFLGTGTQFARFFRYFHLDRLPSTSYLLYAPLAAHVSGIQHIQSTITGVHVVAAETLDESASLFETSSTVFQDGLNSPDVARQHYLDFLLRTGIRVPRQQREGFGSLALAYAFSHATPNNCLPLFWFGGSGWRPLFPR